MAPGCIIIDPCFRIFFESHNILWSPLLYQYKMKCENCTQTIEDRLVYLTHRKKCRPKKIIKDTTCDLCQISYSSSHISRHKRSCIRKIHRKQFCIKEKGIKKTTRLIYKYSSIHPRCKICKKNLLPKQCKRHYFFSCPNNHNVLHNCVSYQREESVSSLFPMIQTSCKRQKKTAMKQLGKKIKRNNIEFTLKHSNYTFVKQYKYSKTFPSLINTNIRPQSDQHSKMIKQNIRDEQFLPLSIADSLGKGKGVFTQVRIEKNTLICSYIGLVGTNLDVTIGDSLFSLGWAHQGDQIIELLVIPHKYSNVGRFINSSSDQIQANCQPTITLLSFQGRNEFCIFLTSTRTIQPFEQLLYYYGPRYF